MIDSNRRRKLFVSIGLCCMILTMPNRLLALSHAWTISDTEIPYLVMLKGNSERSFIVSNPIFCAEVPAACRFFISHAQAHIQLNHLILPPHAYPAGREKIADCYAAKNTPAKEVKAAYKLLQDADLVKKYSIFGDLKLRAEQIKNCAIEAKNWLDN